MRLIDADALIEATNNFCDGYKVNWNDRKVIAWINGAPTIDAVPVVRCKECKFLGFKDFSGICRGSKVYGIVKPNDYCSWGERKDNGT